MEKTLYSLLLPQLVEAVERQADKLTQVLVDLVGEDLTKVALELVLQGKEIMEASAALIYLGSLYT